MFINQNIYKIIKSTGHNGDWEPGLTVYLKQGKEINFGYNLVRYLFLCLDRHNMGIMLLVACIVVRVSKT